MITSKIYKLKSAFGFASIEAAAALTVLLPVAVFAMGIWDYVDSSNLVSDVVLEQINTISVSSQKLTGAGGTIVLSDNSSAVGPALAKLMTDSEKEIKAHFGDRLESYAIYSTFGTKTIGGGYVESLHPSLANGSYQFENPLALTGSRFTLGNNAAIETHVGDELLNNKVGMVGLSISCKLKNTFYSAVLEQLGRSPVISQTQMVEPRGEYAW